MSWTQEIETVELKNLCDLAMVDGIVNYNELLQIFGAAAIAGITATEFADLKDVSSQGGASFANDYLRHIASQATGSNFANDSFWGGTNTTVDVVDTSDMAAGIDAEAAYRLIGEWFLGTDLPMPVAGGDPATGKASTSVLSYDLATGSLFVGGISASDVYQGQAGDCYMLAALGAVANENPALITGLFTDNGNGTYGVRMYWYGAPVYTTVNLLLPVLKDEKLGYAGNPDDSLSGELWVALVEKAYAQLNQQVPIKYEMPWSPDNSYQGIEGGMAYPLLQISGLPYKTYSGNFINSGDPHSFEHFYSNDVTTYKQDIVNALMAGGAGYLGSQVATTGTNGNRELVSGHAFMILGYNPATDKLIIRNPWGEGDEGATYNVQFEISIESIWDTDVYLAITDSAFTQPEYGYTLLNDSSVSSNAVDEAGTITFTLTRDATGTQSSVWLAFGNGTATSGTDFGGLSQLVTFSPYDTVKTVKVSTFGDALFESTESFSARLLPNMWDATATPLATSTAYIENTTPSPFTYSLATAAVIGTPVLEGGAVTINVTRTGGASASTVYFSTRASTADSADYADLAKYAVTFAAHETFKTVTVAIDPDKLAEAKESFFVDLFLNPGDTTANQSIAAYIADVPTPNFTYTVTSNGATQASGVNEGESIVFTIKRSGIGADSSVYVSTAGVSASANDFTGLQKLKVDFAPNQQFAQVTLKTSTDFWLETPEAVRLDIFKNPADIAAATSGTAWIRDVQKALYNYSIPAATTTEGGALEFTITRDGTGTDSMVFVSTLAQTAQEGDYAPFTKQPVVFAAHETSKTVTVQTYADRLDESMETVYLGLTWDLNSSSSTIVGMGNINNAAFTDYGYTIASSANSSSNTVLEGGVVTFTIARSGSGSASTVYLRTGAASATASDYAPQSMTSLSFSEFDTSKTFTVPVHTDGRTEGIEYFWLELYETMQDTAYSAVAAGYIQDAIAPNYSYTVNSSAGTSATAASEGDTVSFTITRSASGAPSSVFVSTTAASAGQGDYAALDRQQVSFAAHETTKLVTVPVYRDAVSERQEYFALDVFANRQDTASAASAFGYVNDAPQPAYDYSISSSAGTAPGAMAEGGTITFTITRSGTGSDSTVYLSTAANSANATDFAALNLEPLTFKANENVKTVTVQTWLDAGTEGIESFWMELRKNLTDVGESAHAQGVIKDTAVTDYGYTVTGPSVDVAEGHEAAFVITRSGTGTASTVYVSTYGADASDIEPLDQHPVSFAAGETSKTVYVPIHKDGRAELLESFWLQVYEYLGDAQPTASDNARIADTPASTTTFTITSSNATPETAVQEGSGVVFYVTRQGSTAQAEIAYVSIVAGTAGASDLQLMEYVPLHFLPGESEASFSTSALVDTTDEVIESFWAGVYRNHGDAQPHAVALGYIDDAPDSPLYTITSSAGTSGAAVSEGGAITFTISRPSAAASAVVFVSTANGSAQAGPDYTALDFEAVFFDEGETTAQVVVNTVADANTEPVESLSLDLFLNWSDTQAQASSVGYLKDGPSWSITSSGGNASTAVAEGQDMVITVTRSFGGDAATVYVSTVDNEANHFGDFHALTKLPVSFAANETSKQVLIPIQPDRINEGVKSFWVDLYLTQSQPSFTTYTWAYVKDGPVNDISYDYTVTSSANSHGTAVTEGGTVTFTITRSGTGTVSTVWADTAYAIAYINDFVARDRVPIKFAANETVKTFTVQTNSDAVVENIENFYVFLYENFYDNDTPGNAVAYGEAFISNTAALPLAAPEAAVVQSTEIHLAYPGHTVSEFTNPHAFAAILDDGSVVSWGQSTQGGDSTSVQAWLDGRIDASQIYSSVGAFAALRADGAVVAWGDASAGGSMGAAAAQLTGQNPAVSLASTESAFAALRADGSVVTWGHASFGGNTDTAAAALSGAVDVVSLYSNSSAFAALRADGSVVTWGLAGYGGDSTAVAASVNGSVDVEQVLGTGAAFAALRADGSVVAWGSTSAGGSLGAAAASLTGAVDAVQLFSTPTAFAALRNDGSVIAWGDVNGGGSLADAAAVDGTIHVVDITASTAAFAALRQDGSVVTWGDPMAGGDSSDVAAQLNGASDVSSIAATQLAFAALRTDGSVVTWGYAGHGGDSSGVAAALDGTVDVVSLVANERAFAALRADGSVVTWGDDLAGGDSSADATALNGSVDVVQLIASGAAFLALRSDGSTVTWGDAGHGGVGLDLGDVSAAASVLSDDRFSDVTPQSLQGGAGPDILTGGSGADQINGLGGTDRLFGSGGNDTINGGAGIDYASFDGAGSRYTISAAQVTDTWGFEGTDTLAQVERFEFADQWLAMDLDGNAGVSAKLICAVFGPELVANPAVVGILLGYADMGIPYETLMYYSLEYALGAGASNDAVVKLIYRNVAGFEIDPDSLALYTGYINDGVVTQAQFSVIAADTIYNAARIDLAGLAQHGLEYDW
ncbi:Calx-beta domain-containing protein [Caenimonas sp. SL110]|uniref:Calx-beta domain-containing protein n=1 Tax=Caenimonas sp. SL110 TaxID=1450524 RepID=UPI00065341DF|nr:Calx-beta domain-containing protein [Caenimonas sp. SL110]